VETERDADGRLAEVWLRLWGLGLLRPQEAGWDRIVLVVALLAALALAGLMGTAPWQAFATALTPAVAPFGAAAGTVVAGAGLLLVTVAFVAVFGGFARLVPALAGGAGDPAAAVAFALTLVPIALLYGTALAWGDLTVRAQALLPLLSDPLGRGWHLLPAGPTWPLPRADAVWYVQVTLVVLGHALAVYLAHLRAGERSLTARRALVAQYPMVVLLVTYTMTSLWILAQPLVAGF
jgi:hypothetical protein